MASNQRKTPKPGAQKPAVEPVSETASQTGAPTKTGSRKPPQPVSKPKWVSALPVAQRPETGVSPVAKVARAEAQDKWVKAAASPDSKLDLAPPARPLKADSRAASKRETDQSPKAPERGAARKAASPRAPVAREAARRDETSPVATQRPPREAKRTTPAGDTAKRDRLPRAPAPTAEPTPAMSVGDLPRDRLNMTSRQPEIEASTLAPQKPAVARPVQPTAEAPKTIVAEAAEAAAKSPVSVEKTQVAPHASAPPRPAPAAPAPKATDPFGMGALGAQYPFPDVQALSRNIVAAIEHGSKAYAAYMRPRETGEIKTTFAEEMGEMVRSLGHVAEYYMADPNRAFEAQKALTTQFINLWAATLQRFQGGAAPPVAEPDRADKRFSHADWSENPFFDFLKQAYVLTTRWADDLVKHADEMEPHARDKAQFYLKQVSAALAPSNFIGTNPELIRATLEESGENLVRGLKMLTEDIEAGKGNLRIRQSDAKAFKLGVNLAVTPGKVVFRNDLIELLQYEPTTAEVYKRPLLIVPPWINKFYILDLNAEKSFIRWAVSQGLTVFVISWINPDSRHADKGFEAYMREGVLTALDCIEQATGERKAAAIGYCVGGTLLAATLGYMAAVGDDRIESATFFATQIDFADPGDLKVFVDAEQLKDGRGADGRAGLSGRLGDGQRLQHAPAERPHLVLLRQQLPQGQRADALRPPGLELRRDPDAGGEPQVLPPPLLPAERPFARAHGSRRQDARPQEGDDSRL